MKNEMVDSINFDYDIDDTFLSVFRGPNTKGQYVYENPNPNADNDDAWLVGETYDDDDRKKVLDIIHNKV